MGFRLRLLLTCAALALPAVGTSGCGAAGGAARGSATPAAGEHDGDADNDSLGGPQDPDNDALPTYAPAASPADTRAITELVKRYYAAVVAQDGRRACSLLHRLVVETFVEEHAGGKGRASPRGTSCAQVASRLLERHRRELTAGVTALRVTIVQVRGNHGWAVVDLGGARKHVAFVRREGSAWKLGAMLGYGDSL